MNNPGSPKRRLPSALEKATRGERSIHPALVPGINVADTGVTFPTNKVVFAVALVFSLAVFIWAVVSPTGINEVGTTMQGWVVEHFAWFFGALIVAIAIFHVRHRFCPHRSDPTGPG